MEGIRPALAVWLGLVICASAQTTPASVGAVLPQPAREIPLYPGVVPGSEKWDWPERSVTTPTGLPMVQDVVRPVLLHYPADRDKAVGTAMIVAPGGGFRTLMMSYEGVDIARRLNAMGIDAFVLKYRLLYTGPGAPSGPASGAAGAGQPKTFSLTGAYKAQAGQDLIALAVDDGRQAVRLVRERAGELRVRPGRIGMMGFSAGGLVTSEALFGPAATRPDFAAVIYGVGEIRETPSPAPPLFLAVAADDALAVDQTVEQFAAYRKGKGSAELHVFQMGAHGFVNKGGGGDHFMDRLEEWLVANRLLVKSPAAIRLAPKPLDDMTERRARSQPTVPSDYTEMPFVETAPEPALTPEEKQRGYVLFQRPIMEPVYPNTKPLAQERLGQLVAFATPGEFEPLTLSLYPARDLQNLKVRCSSLTCEAGAIPMAAITVRLVTYWNVGYPRYTSRSTYRRTPELLERVSVHSSPQDECQRYWIGVHVPEDAKPGLYQGTVSVWDDGFEQAVEIPVFFRVLAFELQKDPAKHYSAYYYVRNRSQYASKSESFVRAASANEYQAMVEYGLDMTPTLYLRSDDGKTISLPYADELDRMLEAGLKGPVPVTADSIIGRFYRDTTPGGQQGSHWNISQLPPPEFYERITAAFKAFESEREAKGWPEFICCPIDEVAVERTEFGAKVYAAVKAAGIRTYATKDPTGADAAAYRPYIDIWCSQPYSVPYEKIISQDRYEYWCYPNHNAGEIKDRLVMCKGGRMTYGFGFWRSGYTTLIPWHWSWTPGADQFDCLRGPQSGCGQRINEDGEVIPAVYWECFREGVDDARYIYTLQQAVFQREGSPDARCRRVVASARKLLQDTWDAINVQQKYLADGMWPSEEFNTRCWLLAQATSELLRHPAVRTGSVPSVLVTNTTPRPAQVETSSIDRTLRAGNIQAMDLGGDFAAWSNGTQEGRIEITAVADHPERKELCWRVHIDHEMDGGEGGKYPVGWPRIARSFREGELDFSDYDYLSLLIRVDSNRDEVADDSTRLGLSLRSHSTPQRLFDTQMDLGDRQRQWIPQRFAVRELIDRAGAGPAPWRSVSNLQLFLAESEYAHGTDLAFEIRDIELLRFTSPVIERVDVPAYVMLPCERLAVSFDIVGTRSVRPGSHIVTLSLASADGRTRTQQQQDLANEYVVILDTSTLVPGRHHMDLAIIAADGTRCSQERRLVEAVAGPLAP